MKIFEERNENLVGFEKDAGGFRKSIIRTALVQVDFEAARFFKFRGHSSVVASSVVFRISC